MKKFLVLCMVSLSTLMLSFNVCLANDNEIFFWRGKDVTRRSQIILDYYADINKVHIHDNNRYCRAMFNAYKQDGKRKYWAFIDFYRNVDGEVVAIIDYPNFERVVEGNNFCYALYSVIREYVDVDNLTPRKTRYSLLK